MNCHRSTLYQTNENLPVHIFISVLFQEYVILFNCLYEIVEQICHDYKYDFKEVFKIPFLSKAI